jgi:hypothetical protein
MRGGGMKQTDCRECGKPCVVNDDGTATHVDDESPTGVDHDADADHVPVPELDDEYTGLFTDLGAGG